MNIIKDNERSIKRRINIDTLDFNFLLFHGNNRNKIRKNGLNIYNYGINYHFYFIRQILILLYLIAKNNLRKNQKVKKFIPVRK